MKRKVLPCFMALSMTLTAAPNVVMAEDGSMNEAETVVETTVETEPAKESAGEVGAPEVVDTTEETKEETTEETVVEAVEIQPAMVMATAEVAAENGQQEVKDAAELKAAVENAADGVETTIRLTADIVVAEPITVKKGQNIILDMDGHKITVTDSFVSRIFTNNGTLTIKGNGTIDVTAADANGYGAVNNFGTLTVVDGTYKALKETDAYIFYNRSGGTVIFENPTVEGGCGAIATQINTTTEIHGGSYSDETYPTIENRGNMLITGGTFKNTSCSSCDGRWGYTIRSGESSDTAYLKIQGETEDSVKVTGVQGGLAVIGGTADIYNGSYVTEPCKVHTNGASAFYAGYFTGESYKTSTNIYGGTFQSASKNALQIGNSNPAPDSGAGKESTVMISGGTFIGGDAAQTAIKVDDAENAIGGANITGGTFSSDVEEFVDPSSSIVKDEVTGEWVTKPIPIEDAVASVGEKNYKTLADAVENAAAGDTVKLIKPVELTETLTIDKGIDLDLNKNTITIKGSVAEDGILISTSEDADVVIYNGTITDERGKDQIAIGKNTINIKGQANVTTKDLTVEAYAPKDQSSPYYNYLLRIQPDDSQNVGSLTLDAGTKIQELSNGSGETYGVVGITAIGAYANGNDVPEDYEGVKVVIKDGVFVETTGYALSGNGSKHGTTFIIEGGNLYSKESTAIYHPQMGTMTISGDNTIIKGGNTGIEVRAGNVTIKDGVVEGLAIPTEVDGNGNGTTSTGAGIAIAQHTTKLPINVTITGGEFKGYSAFYESNPQGNPADELNKINISIVDGTFTATNGGTAPIYSEDKQNFITGGTYSNALDNNYLGDNYQLTPNENGTFGVDYNKDGAVAKAGEVYCKTLKEAGERVKDGETISILKNIDDVTDFMKIDGKKNVTIDLNGYTINGSGYDGVINAVNGATVTIDGRDANSAITANEDRGYAMAVCAYGQGTKVTINGGSYTQNITGTGDQFDMIYASDKATIEILNGYFKSATPKWTLNLKDNDGATMLVKGGSFVDYDPSNSQSENPPADFVADGYKVSESNGVYTVSKKSSGGSHRYDGYITIINPKNGTVSVSDDWADEDQKITLTITPDKGYVVDKIEIVDAEGDKIDAKKVEDKDDKYTFRMANCDVTVTVTFKEEGKTEDKEETTTEETETEETTKPETITFTDVKESDWFYKGVSYVVENDMMNGVGNDQFAPNAPLTREMLAVVLYNMEKQPESTGVNPFADVKADMWYTDAIVWANANGIVAGYDDSTFGLGDSITREQLATILYRYAQLKGYDVTEKADLTGYTDSTAISGYAVEAMQWANANGIVNGMTETTLAPQGTATRAQVATMLMNFCENVATKAE
ncbi:MAG: S-layer homology domain-containing protein [Anaerotignum sp.]